MDLTEFSLYGNSLTGKIPSEIGNLINLTAVSLGKNQFTEEIPADIGNLINLNYIGYLFNYFTTTFNISLFVIKAFSVSPARTLPTPLGVPV